MGSILAVQFLASCAKFSGDPLPDHVEAELRPPASRPVPPEALRGRPAPVDSPTTATTFTPTAVPPALLDGTADATTFIQLQLDAAAPHAATVALPAGRYRIDGSLLIPRGVTLAGTWTAPHHANLRTGTVLLATGGRGAPDGPPLLRMEPSSAVRGLTIFYPEQVIDPAPVEYPWSIRVRGMHCTIENVTLVNSWRGIDLATEWNECHLVRNVFGSPLKVGVSIDKCTDIGRLENVHFNPHYWVRDEGDKVQRPNSDKVYEWILRNGEAFVFGRTDWQYVTNTFCYGYRVGYRFIATPDGAANGQFLGIGSDGGEIAVLIEESAPWGLLFTNGEFVAMRGERPIQIVTGPKNRGVAQFSNCAFWGPTRHNARLEGGSTSFSQCNFQYWDAGKRGDPGIDIIGGSAIVQGCIFHHPGKQIRIGPDARSLIATGNLMQDGEQIENLTHSDSNVFTAGNLAR